MFILDTSAIRSISRDKLQSISKNHKVTISPITFYELLCHLDETKNEMTFKRQKGNVLKCQIPEILMDPFALHAVSVRAEKCVNPSRFEEPYIIKQVLEKLEEADNLSKFYSETVVFKDGSTGFCKDIAMKDRKHLEKEETQYLNLLNIIKSDFIEKYPELFSIDMPPEGFEILAKKCINHLKDTYCKEDGIPDNDLLSKVYDSIYIYYSYAIANVLKNIKNGDLFQKNDFEDGYITLHLNLSDNDALVTNDKETIGAFEKTIAALKSIKKDTKVRVINVPDFLSETLYF